MAASCEKNGNNGPLRSRNEFLSDISFSAELEKACGLIPSRPIRFLHHIVVIGQPDEPFNDTTNKTMKNDCRATIARPRCTAAFRGPHERPVRD